MAVPVKIDQRITLEDKYDARAGRIYLTGVQALVRLPLMQRQRDLAAGLNTAGYITGYRGSPIGGYDLALWAAKKHLEANHIRFVPAINEDLAATALHGTQVTHLFESPKYDGVFGIWYGKGPGYDRSVDALKHGNMLGASAHGGVLAIAGDDHGGVSSSFPHQSEQAMISTFMPVLNPAGVQDFLDLGLLGFALSRFSACWVGMVAVGETLESAATVSADPDRVNIVIPADFEEPEGFRGSVKSFGPHIEPRMVNDRMAAVAAFVRANAFDRVTLDSPKARYGIAATGKAFLDLRQAFDDLGISEERAAELGLRVYKIGLSWPLEAEGAAAFARGLDEILVIEEKRALIETQLKEQLYHLPAGQRPRIIGKRDETGAPLLPESGELTPAMIAGVLARRLGISDEPAIKDRLGWLAAKAKQMAEAKPALQRTPFFCSGCPHNTSTKLPEGSMAIGGIGCHGMAMFMDMRTVCFSQMGGEGASWCGVAPFTDIPHMFQNMGDGTYFHSGHLALRQAVAAKMTMTFKILFNDAVAMTGGQPLDGEISVPQITHQVYQEGVRRIAVVSDEPEKYGNGSMLAPGATLHHRKQLDAVQREMREVEGVSVIVYDQTCAAEKRRRRKRGTYPDPARRAFINDLVCEGCGDCGVLSNCMSVMPKETEMGRKRVIDQSACNKDFSCVEGFCPSFVTVEGGAIRKPAGLATAGDRPFQDLPEPEVPQITETFNILVGGVGGTGVITVGALLGMAAHLEGKGVSVLDFTGMAQKGGSVISHVRIAPSPSGLSTPRVGDGTAHTLLACDMVVGASPETVAKLREGVSRALVNSFEIPTAAVNFNPDAEFGAADMIGRIRDAVGEDSIATVNASRLATVLEGDSIGTNLFMLGFAYQKGWLPLSGAALERAIELNGVAIDKSIRTFKWGRLAAHDPEQIRELTEPLLEARGGTHISRTLDEVISRREAELTGYQDAAYAARYRALVDRVREAEAVRAPGMSALAEAVARNFFKLMAYKDEYEVSRLYSDGRFRQRLEAQFEGDYRLRVHMSPPLLARRDPVTGRPGKRLFGPWIFPLFRALAALKGLRGTALDPFGYTAERRTERRLRDDYENTLISLLDSLQPGNHGLAVAIAAVPEQIRGFGFIKMNSMAEAAKRRQELFAAYHSSAPDAVAAE